MNDKLDQINNEIIHNLEKQLKIQDEIIESQKSALKGFKEFLDQLTGTSDVIEEQDKIVSDED